MPQPPGRTLHVVSTKYDGSAHYAFDAVLLDRAGPMLRLFIDAGTLLDGYRGRLRTEVAFTALFWTDRDYNIYHNHRPAGRRRILSYANVALPARLDGETLRWVDLDLDVMAVDDGRVIVDDEDEFADHRTRFAYPDDVVERAQKARDELLRLARAGGFPFDRATHIEATEARSGGG